MLTRTLTFCALLLSTFSSQAVVTLNPGETYQTTFALQSNGDFYKNTDLFWEAYAQIVSPADPEAIWDEMEFVTFTLYENIDLTGASVTKTGGSWFGDGQGGFGFGGDQSFLQDLSGSLSIRYAGLASLELQRITVSNFNGNVGPSFVATTTFEPFASAVPWPPTAMMLVPGLLVTGLVAARRRRSARQTD